MNEQIPTATLENRSGLRKLTEAEINAVDGGIFALIGIVFPFKHANSRTQGDVNNISDIIAP